MGIHWVKDTPDWVQDSTISHLPTPVYHTHTNSHTYIHVHRADPTLTTRFKQQQQSTHNIGISHHYKIYPAECRAHWSSHAISSVCPQFQVTFNTIIKMVSSHITSLFSPSVSACLPSYSSPPQLYYPLQQLAHVQVTNTISHNFPLEKDQRQLVRWEAERETHFGSPHKSRKIPICHKLGCKLTTQPYNLHIQVHRESEVPSVHYPKTII